MSESSSGSQLPRLDNGLLRAIRHLYGLMLPTGTRRRRWMSSALVVVWEVRNAAIRTRDEWRRRREESGPEERPTPQPAVLTFHEWFYRLPAEQDVLAAQRELFEQWPKPLRAWGLVIDDGGDLAATEKSLRDQSWGQVEVAKVVPSELDEEFRRLSQDHPDDMVFVLRAGDRLRPDAVFEVAKAAWRDPWLELVLLG